MYKQLEKIVTKHFIEVAREFKKQQRRVFQPLKDKELHIEVYEYKPMFKGTIEIRVNFKVGNFFYTHRLIYPIPVYKEMYDINADTFASEIKEVGARALKDKLGKKYKVVDDTIY